MISLKVMATKTGVLVNSTEGPPRGEVDEKGEEEEEEEEEEEAWDNLLNFSASLNLAFSCCSVGPD